MAAQGASTERAIGFQVLADEDRFGADLRYLNGDSICKLSAKTACDLCIYDTFERRKRPSAAAKSMTTTEKQSGANEMLKDLLAPCNRTPLKMKQRRCN